MNDQIRSIEQGVLLDLSSLDKQDLDLAPLTATLPRWRIYRHTPQAQVAARLRGAQVAVLNKVRLDATTLDGLPDLRLVCVTATGVDNVDVAAARARGITVCNARDYATASVVQHWLALLLTLVRHLDDYRARVRNGAWSASAHFCLLDRPIAELGELTLGIVGHGTLGRAVAEQARSLGMRVRVGERRGRPPRPGRLPWERLLAEVDVLSLHCPLTRETRHLMDAEAFSRMRPGALLINTARGALVDPHALAAALRRGHLGGAALDVLEREPPPPDHPLLDPSVPRLVLTPHIAWASRRARQRLIEQTAENIRAYLAGTPLRVVEPG